MSEFHDKIDQLIGRMLTCATFLVDLEISKALNDAQFSAICDARSLLIEAAAVLEKLDPPPEPMEIIKPLPPRSDQTFVDPGVGPRNHPVSKSACPGCDSRAIKTVHRVDNWLELECPVCGTRWKYSNIKKAKWI
jgi:hypothetical protein